MIKLHFIAVFTVLGFLGLQYALTTQTQRLPKNPTKKNQSTIHTEKQNHMYAPNKFEFQPLAYAYDALEPYIDKLTVGMK